MPGFYRLINPVDSSGKTRRTVGEMYDDLYALGWDVKSKAAGSLINPWDVQAFAENPGSQRAWDTQISNKQAEEKQRMALIDEVERAKKSAESTAMSGMSSKEKEKYRERLKAQKAEEELRLYLEQNTLHAAERKKGLMPRSIQAISEEKPFDALDRMKDEMWGGTSRRSGMMPGRGGY